MVCGQAVCDSKQTPALSFARQNVWGSSRPQAPPAKIGASPQQLLVPRYLGLPAACPGHYFPYQRPHHAYHLELTPGQLSAPFSASPAPGGQPNAIREDDRDKIQWGIIADSQDMAARPPPPETCGPASPPGPSIAPRAAEMTFAPVPSGGWDKWRQGREGGQAGGRRGLGWGLEAVPAPGPTQTVHCPVLTLLTCLHTAPNTPRPGPPFSETTAQPQVPWGSLLSPEGNQLTSIM